MSPDRVLEVAIELGKDMLVNGAEVGRVEDTIGRICRAYGVNSVDVFSITSSIVVTIHDKEGNAYTQTRRISSYSANLEKVDLLNALSRKICSTYLEEDEIFARLNEIKNKKPYPLWFRVLMCALIAFVFTPFFGGNWYDAAASATVAVILRLLITLMQRLEVNPVLSNVVCSFVTGICVIFVMYAGLGDNLDKIIIGNIMILIPGITLTNSARDLIGGDIMTGILRFCEAVLLAVGIAVGFALANLLMKDYIVQSGGLEQNPAFYVWIVQILASLFGSFGFSALNNVGKRNIVVASVGGMLTWVVYLVLGLFVKSDALLNLFSAAFSTFYAIELAKIMKTPTTTFLISGIIPLIPGSYLYYSMNSAVKYELNGFVDSGIKTLTIVISIAAGIILVSTIYKILPRRQKANG